jgi:hypothetical protein
MSIESAIADLASAIKENTETQKALLALVATNNTDLPAKKRRTAETKAIADERRTAEATAIADAIADAIANNATSEDAPAPVEDAPAPVEDAPADPTPVVEVTQENIRDYVKAVRDTGRTDFLAVVGAIRKEFGVSNLAELKPDQTGPFLARVMSELPLG